MHIQIKYSDFQVFLVDVELGCGASIAKHSETTEIFYLVVSPATEDYRNKNIIEELYESAAVLNVPQQNIHVWDFPRRKMCDQASLIRKKIIDIVEELKPKTIFCTCPNDRHQDHEFVGKEVSRLFRTVSVFGYEVISSSLDFVPDTYVPVETKHVRLKIEALSRYRSQIHRSYFKPEVIRSLACTRGAQIQVRYAEAFKTLRLIT